MSTDFLYDYFRYVRAHLESIAPQSAQKSIHLQVLGSLLFPVISLAEQHCIVADLDALPPAVLDRAFAAAGIIATPGRPP